MGGVPAPPPPPAPAPVPPVVVTYGSPPPQYDDAPAPVVMTYGAHMTILLVREFVWVVCDVSRRV